MECLLARGGGDRGDHELHEHVEPVGGAGGGAGCEEGGSKVVMDYYREAGLIPYLEALNFHLVGFGCTTCIGNSGPLPEPVAEAVFRPSTP